MAKPIAIIYFPDFFDGGKNRNWIYEYMRFLNGEQTNNDQKIDWGEKKDYWTEYYWFCFYDSDIQTPEIRVYHEKDWTEANQQQLTELIMQSISEIKK